MFGVTVVEVAGIVCGRFLDFVWGSEISTSGFEGYRREVIAKFTEFPYFN